MHSHKPAGLTVCFKAKFALTSSIASLTGYEPCALTSFSLFNTLVGPGEAVRRIRNGLGLQLCHHSLCLDSCSPSSFQTRHSGCPSAPFVQISRLGFFGVVQNPRAPRRSLPIDTSSFGNILSTFALCKFASSIARHRLVRSSLHSTHW